MAIGSERGCLKYFSKTTLQSEFLEIFQTTGDPGMRSRE
jgi:hypothetical protein